MSQNTQPTSPPEDGDNASIVEATIPQVNESADPKASGAADTPAAEESTVGTGTSMALGCIAGTVLLILFGLLFLAISTLV